MMDPQTRLLIAGQVALIGDVLQSASGYAAQNLLAEYESSHLGRVDITENKISLTMFTITGSAGPSHNRHTDEPTRPTCAAALRAWQHAARDRMTHPGVAV